MQSSSINNRLGQPIAEINGRPGVVWGNVIVPASGRSKIKIKLVGDQLQTNIDLAYGLEKKDILTFVQDVSSIEIVQGRLWWLLGLGFLTLFIYFIGIVFIVLFFVIKQRWIVFYTSNLSLILFYKKTENVEDFRHTVFKIKRQLNASLTNKTNGKPPAPPLPNNSHSAGLKDT